MPHAIFDGCLSVFHAFMDKCSFAVSIFSHFQDKITEIAHSPLFVKHFGEKKGKTADSIKFACVFWSILFASTS